MYGNVQLNFQVVCEAGIAPLALSKDMVSADLGGRCSAGTGPMATAAFLQCRLLLVGRFLNAGYLPVYGTSPSRCGGPGAVYGGALLEIIPEPLRYLMLAL